MKTSLWNVLILVLIIGMTGCKKEKDDDIPVPPEESGVISVSVVFNGQPVPSATINTNPFSEEVITDESGHVMIENVSPGFYQVFATNEEIGSGSVAVAVDPGAVTNVTIELIYGVFVGLNLDLVMVSAQAVGLGDTIVVAALVTDIIDSSEDIEFVWSTEVDGVISTEGVGDEGYALLEHIFETEGDRTLTVTVTNSAGHTDTAQVALDIVVLPDPVVLNSIEVENFELTLNWSQAETEDFQYYFVYRETPQGFMVTDWIGDINTTSFTDSQLNIGTVYSYRIGLRLQNGLEFMSNIESALLDGEHISIGTGLDMLLHDPNNPIIYGLDTENNSLVFINTELGEVVNSIFVGSIPTDMDFSLDNQLLYIANYGSTNITVVDLASQSVQSSVMVVPGSGATDGNPYSLAVLANGLLAYASEDQWNRIKVVEIATGDQVYTSSQSIKAPYLVANSNGTKLFAGETGSNTDLFAYNLINDELVLQESSSGSGNSLRKIFVTDNDEFVFYSRRKYQANSISDILGNFGNHVYAVNSNGSLVLRDDRVYNGNDFSIVDYLPFTTEVSVFDTDNNTAYLFHEQSERLYKFTIE